MSEWKPKRFWKEVGVGEAEDGFTVLLDGRPLRTPAKAPLVLPTRPLAEAVAAEWAAQQDVLRPETMPATRTANSAIDTVAPNHETVAATVAEYGGSDLLCYRAETPQELVERQAAGWDPLLDWAADVLGARLEPTAGVIHKAQDAGALARLSEATRAFAPFELAAFHDLVTLSGSLIIGFAVAFERESPEALWGISRIDETWQAELWGEDEEAAAQAVHKKEAFLHAAHIFQLARRDGAPQEVPGA